MSGIMMISVGNSYGSLPVNTVAPVVSGTAQQGQTLSTTNGTWTAAPAITGYTYQWQRNTSNIGGATSSTYLLQAADVGNTVRCVVTATNALGSTSANSNSTGTIQAPPTFLNITTTGSPIITESGNYRIARFNGSGSFTVNSVGSGSPESNTIQYFLVGGGGPFSASSRLGGGGGGGIKENSTNDYVVTAQTYGVTVGAAGSESSISVDGSPLINVGSGAPGGAQSAGFSAGTIGGCGGGGGFSYDPIRGFAGGSGSSGTGNTPFAVPGFAGGSGAAENITSLRTGAGGGGGGAGGAGGSGNAAGFGGNGGPGRATTIRGFTEIFAGGGGGGGQRSDGKDQGATGGAGGSGGGGNGGAFRNVSGGSTFATAGAANSGGGGGGSATGGQPGGSGVVIIRWRFQ